MKSNHPVLRISALFLGLFTLSVVSQVFTATAHADESFRRKHPRRAEVNARERRQQKEVAEGVESGKLNANEAAKIESQEARIKRQEVREVRRNGGYLKKGQQRRLNQELHGVQKEIKEDEKN